MRWTLLVLAIACGLAQAQYPTRPVRLIVPFPPGAGTDVVARAIATKLGGELGQPIVVENRTGAGGALGAESVARAEPDGYMLLFVASPFTTLPAAAAKPPYDPVRDYAAVALVATGPLVLVAAASLPAADMAGLIAYARARPGVLNYASAGAGGVNHLALELLQLRTGTSFAHIPYRGIGPALVDALGGSIQTLTATVPAVLPHVRAGKLKALAVTGARRTPLLAEVPTLRESGIEDVEVYNYWGFVAPAGTPRPVVERVHRAVVAALAAPDLRARLADEGVDITAAGPADFAAFLVGDLARWQRVVREARLGLM